MTNQNEPIVIEVRVNVRRGNWTNGLEFCERAEIGEVTFLEAAKILGQFHDLVQTLGGKVLEGGR